MKPRGCGARSSRVQPGHRDHGEQDHDEHRQRGYLRPSVCAFARSIAKPQPHNDGCQKNPGEVEDYLHSQSQFYITGFAAYLEEIATLTRSVAVTV